MAKAKELVLESSVSISELYQYTGYNNAASFRRAFKKFLAYCQNKCGKKQLPDYEPFPVQLRLCHGTILHGHDEE